jgi:uncharacterized membrane protein
MSPSKPAIEPRPGTAARPKQRVQSVDLVRGLIMIIMALDHARDFFRPDTFDPTDLTHASAALFLTRLVTHLCAPTFMFLAGTSAYLSSANSRPLPVRSRYLLTRGLWLIVLDVIVLHFAFQMFPDMSFQFIAVGTLWALGWAMIALAGFIWLPLPAIAGVAGAIVLLHNLADRWGVNDTFLPAWLWSMLHVQGVFPLPGGRHIMFFYPIVPWIGVMALGYAFAPSLRAPADARRKRCLAWGVGLLVAFTALRASNLYGDPSPWAAPPGRPHWFTLLAFFNTQKYPPSLLYLLMTLGTMFLLLAVADGWQPAARPLERLRGAVIVFGRVPLFFYFAHLALLHVMRLLDHLARFRTLADAGDHGYALPGVYLAWAIAILLLYPICARYDAYKRAHPRGWTRYL